MNPVPYWRDYFADNTDIVALCDALTDRCNGGLGLIWQSTDFDGIFERLAAHPDNWVISQCRDELKARIAGLDDSQFT